MINPFISGSKQALIREKPHQPITQPNAPFDFGSKKINEHRIMVPM
jgi:hypothetical protein